MSMSIDEKMCLIFGQTLFILLLRAVFLLPKLLELESSESLSRRLTKMMIVSTKEQ